MTIGIFEAKQKLSELVERAAQGEEIVITCRGKERARLVGRPLRVSEAYRKFSTRSPGYG